MQLKMKNYLKSDSVFESDDNFRKTDVTDKISEPHVLNIQIQSRCRQLEN